MLAIDDCAEFYFGEIVGLEVGIDKTERGRVGEERRRKGGKKIIAKKPPGPEEGKANAYHNMA